MKRATLLVFDRRGVAALMFATTMPVLISFIAVCVELCTLAINQAELQRTADVAAEAGGLALSNSASSQTAATIGAEVAEVNGATGAASRTWTSSSSTLSDNQISVTIGQASQGQTVTVTVTKAVSLPVTAALHLRSSATLTGVSVAVVTSPPVCALALSSPGIQVNNMGSIVASGCGVFSNATGGQSIYLNSGTISGKTVGAVGTVSTSNSGSNSLSPSPADSNAAAQPNRYASTVAPTAGACSYPNGTSFTSSYPPYSFSAGTVFCGNTTIGGNGNTAAFAPGVYYVVNGSLTFSNASITQGTGVTFVLTGTSPGGFNWTNNSATTLTAPTSGTTAGILVWQTCSSSGTAGTSSFNGGSALQVSGEIYAPCGAVSLSNNAHVATVSGGSMGVVAGSISVVGSAELAPASGTSAGGSTGGQVALMQ